MTKRTFLEFVGFLCKEHFALCQCALCALTYYHKHCIMDVYGSSDGPSIVQKVHTF